MADVLKRINEFLSEKPTLRDGEHIVAAAKAMPLGQIKKNAKRQGPLLVGGVVGALIMHSQDKKVTQDNLSSHMKSGVYLLATNQRLILIGAGGLRVLPQEILASVERERLTHLQKGTTRVSLVKMMTITCVLDDGSEMSFEFPKVDTQDGERLFAALAKS